MNKILYLGKDDLYFRSLIEKLNKVSKLEVELIDLESHALEIFSHIETIRPLIIVVDFSLNLKALESFQHALLDYSEGITKYFIALISADERDNIGIRAAVGDYAFFVKSLDSIDVISCLQQLAEPQGFVSQQVAEVPLEQNFLFQQAIQATHISLTRSTIETNAEMDESVYEMVLPFAEKNFHSTSHRVSKKTASTRNSFFRFSYELEYEFLRNPILSGQDMSKILQNVDYDLAGSLVSKEMYQILEQEEKKPKRIILAADKIEETDKQNPETEESILKKKATLALKTQFCNKLIASSSSFEGEQDNITVYDPKFSDLAGKVDRISGEGAYVSIRPFVLNPSHDVFKHRPSVIVISWNELNNIEKLKELIAAATQLKNYFPFFLVFDYAEEMTLDELRDHVAYHYVVATRLGFNEEMVIKMLSVYRNKRQQKDNLQLKQRLDQLQNKHVSFYLLNESHLNNLTVRKKVGDPSAIFFFSFEATIISISELEIVFTSERKFELGDVLVVEIPLRVQIVIVALPTSQANSYRGVIHFVNESDKQSLRRFINSALGEEDEASPERKAI